VAIQARLGNQHTDFTLGDHIRSSCFGFVLLRLCSAISLRSESK
jgi:hypothetical protein